ncbi:MAG: cache domain-containing protein [Bacteroidota bacterium]
MSIKSKMLVFILLVSSIIYVFAVGYVSYKFKSTSLTNSKENIDALAKQHANNVKADLDVEMIMSRGLAQTFETYQGEPLEEWKQRHNEILENIIKKNPNFLSVWTNLELDKVTSWYDEEDGRIRLTYYRAEGEIKYKEEILDTTPDFDRGAYYDVKESGEELVMDPYYFAYTEEEEEILETSVGAPLMKDDEFIGLAGIDLSLERFQPVIEKIEPYENSYAFLISNDGSIVTHPEDEYINGNIADFEDYPEDISLLEKIKNGESVSYTRNGIEGQSDFYVSYAPLIIGKTKTPWSLGLAVPLDVVMAEAQKALERAVLVGIIGLIVVAFIIWLIAHTISRSIKRTTSVLGDLAQGNIDRSKKLNIRTKDEIGQMGRSLNTLIEGLNKTAGFAKEIGKGNLDKDFQLLSDQDTLGQSLLEMRESLKQAKKKEDERKREEEKQNWANKGLAKFGDILRQNPDDINEFAYNILSNLVKYVNAIQGGLYLINDEDKNDRHIEMAACYAYSRRKYVEKRIEMEEGLIGRCVKEQKSIHLTEIPEEYVNITSGLGESTPNSILIVPLKVNDEVFGAVELATFKGFEDHVIKFVEDLGENIASTIKTTKINLRTNQLLEQSQQQSEELSSQEEEMRQNMEELKATQEEANRRSAEMEGFINALKESNHVVEYDLEGKILDVNENFLKLLKMKKEELVGLHHKDYQEHTKEDLKQYDKFWEDLNKGKSKKRTSTLKVGKNRYTFVETYTPILNKDGKPEKILKIATDISEIKK